MLVTLKKKPLVLPKMPTTLLSYRRRGLPWVSIFSQEALPHWLQTNRLRIQQQRKDTPIKQWGVDWWEDGLRFSLDWVIEEGYVESDIRYERLCYDQGVNEDYSKTPVRSAEAKTIFDHSDCRPYIPRSYFETFYWKRIKPYSYWLHELIFYKCLNYLFLYPDFLGAFLTRHYIFRFMGTCRRKDALPLLASGEYFRYVQKKKERPRSTGTASTRLSTVSAKKKKKIIRRNVQYIFGVQSVGVFHTIQKREAPESLEVMLRNRHKYSLLMSAIGFFTVRWRVPLWRVFEMSFINQRNVALMSFWFDMQYRGFSPRMLYDRLARFYRRNRAGLFGSFETYILGLFGWLWYSQKHAALFFNFTFSLRYVVKAICLFELASLCGGLREMVDIGVDDTEDPGRKGTYTKADSVAEEFDEPGNVRYTYPKGPDQVEWLGQSKLREFSTEHPHPLVSELLASESGSSSTDPWASNISDTRHLSIFNPYYRSTTLEYFFNLPLEHIFDVEHPRRMYRKARRFNKYYRFQRWREYWQNQVKTTIIIFLSARYQQFRENCPEYSRRFFRFSCRLFVQSLRAFFGLIKAVFWVLTNILLPALYWFFAGVCRLLAAIYSFMLSSWFQPIFSLCLPGLVRFARRYPKVVKIFSYYLRLGFILVIYKIWRYIRCTLPKIAERYYFWHTEILAMYWISRDFLLLHLRQFIFGSLPLYKRPNFQWAIVGLKQFLFRVFDALMTVVSFWPLSAFWRFLSRAYSRQWTLVRGISGSIRQAQKVHPRVDRVRAFWWLKVRIYTWGFWGRSSIFFSNTVFRAYYLQCRIATLIYKRTGDRLHHLSEKFIDEGDQDRIDAHYNLYKLHLDKLICLGGANEYYVKYQDKVVAELDGPLETGYVD